MESLNPLLPYQSKGVVLTREFLERGGRAYNASEPGLGKTLMTLRACAELGFQKILVIAPASVKGVWRDEVNKWDENGSTYITSKSSDLLDPKIIYTSSKFWVVSYALARLPRVAAFLSEQNFDCLILDEAHAVKTPKAAQSKAILGKIWPRIPYRIALSGTPLTRSIADLYSLFSRMAPTQKHFQCFSDFVNRYCLVEDTPWGVKFHGSKNVDELRQIAFENFFFRFEKSEVADQLPEKRFQRVLLSPRYALRPSKEEALAWKAYAHALKAAYSGCHGSVPTPPVALSSRRKEQGLKKLPMVVEFIKNLVACGSPTVVWCVHREVVNKLAEELKLYNPQIGSGAYGQEERAQNSQNFQEGKSNLFIGTYAAAGVGINLNRGSYVVLAELDYSPGVVSQAIDRCHRLGAKAAMINAYYFVVEGSLEEGIEEGLIGKSKTFEKVLQ